MAKQNIRELLQLITGAEQPVFEGEVLSVNSDRTCKVKIIDSELTLNKVRVQALASYTSGIYPKLKANTKGIVMFVGQVPYMVITGETEEVSINGDQHGGLAIVSNLVNKLNAIENKVNSIISAHNGHQHPDPSSGSTGTPSIIVEGTLNNTQTSDIENDKVKHG
jgi:hypothetical protein